MATANFLHLHGQLEEFPWWSQPIQPGRGRSYSNTYDCEVIARCAKAIKVVGDADLQAEQSFDDAHELLGRSEAICFLGFGYHADSLQRLQSAEFAKGRQVFGTAYGLTQYRRDALGQEISGITLGGPSEEIIPFLNRLGVLHRSPRS